MGGTKNFYCTPIKLSREFPQNKPIWLPTAWSFNTLNHLVDEVMACSADADSCPDRKDFFFSSKERSYFDLVGLPFSFPFTLCKTQTHKDKQMKMEWSSCHIAYSISIVIFEMNMCELPTTYKNKYLLGSTKLMPYSEYPQLPRAGYSGYGIELVDPR